MITFNGLSLFSFKDFLNDVWTLRTIYNDDDAHNRIPFMLSYLRWPEHQSIKIIPEAFKDKYFPEILEFVKGKMRKTSPSRAGRFYLEELDQVERLIEYSKNTNLLDETAELRSYFYQFFEEYDRRKGTTITEVFPEMKEYWKHCEEMYHARKSLWNR
jgi:hypothetical protein